MSVSVPSPLSRRAVIRFAVAVAAAGVLAPLARRVALAADPRLGQLWRCSSSECPGYEYDPMLGDPDSGIAPGTAFQDLSADWYCPRCGAGKVEFRMISR